MRAILLTLLLTVGIPSLRSQTEAPAGFLWHVNINNSDFWLAGSIHTGKEEFYPLPKLYEEAFNQADYVIFELKESNETLKKMILTYATKDRLNEDEYLNNYLNEESKELLSELFKGKEDLLLKYYSYEGWLLNMVIGGTRNKFIGYDPELAVDKYFHDLATKEEKPIIGLETLETQLKLFDFELPLENQVQIIEAAIGRAKEQAQAEQVLFDSYYSQDTEAFRKAFQTTMDLNNPQVKAMYNRVFVGRNKAWVEKLIDLSKTQPGHYFGPENLLKLLEKEGYEAIPHQSIHR